MATKDSKAKGFCLTINNWTQEIYDKLVAEKTDYKIIGKEVGESGTPHLQAYIFNRNTLRFSTLKKKYPTAHIETAKGTPADNKKYCSKDGDFFEEGECPKNGRRTDLEEAREIINETGKIRDVANNTNSLQAVKAAECIIKYIERKRDWKPKVTWIYGKSGCGKTKQAHEAFKDKDMYRKSNGTGQWWDGYDAHEYVIIDDVKDITESYYLSLLELLDRYETRIQYKGGTRQFLAKEIILTSIWHPKDMYSIYENASEIIRRIDEIIECV